MKLGKKTFLKFIIIIFFIFGFLKIEPEPAGEPKGEPESEPKGEPEGEPKGEPESEPKGEPEGIFLGVL